MTSAEQSEPRLVWRRPRWLWTGLAWLLAGPFNPALVTVWTLSSGEGFGPATGLMRYLMSMSLIGAGIAATVIAIVACKPSERRLWRIAIVWPSLGPLALAAILAVGWSMVGVVELLTGGEGMAFYMEFLWSVSILWLTIVVLLPTMIMAFAALRLVAFRLREGTA